MICMFCKERKPTINEKRGKCTLNLRFRADTPLVRKVVHINPRRLTNGAY